MSSIKNLPFRSAKAFTLVEILVVITVIVILTAVGVFAFTRYQQTADDSERDAKANIIASALEKYFDENNEYPSCGLLTEDPATVKSTTLKSLADENILKAPRDDDGANSIKCAANIPSSPDDGFIYTCTNSTIACAKWELKYRNDADGKIKTIASMHTANVAANGAVMLDAPTVTLTATLSGQNAVATAAATCPSGTPEYQIRYYKNSGSFPAWASGGSATVPGLNEGEKASFQAQARCSQSGVASSDYSMSNIATANRAVTAPTGLTTNVAISGTNAVATIGGGSCATGTTLKRQVRSNNTNVNYGGTWTSFADFAGSSQSVAAQEGWWYGWQQQAQCVNTTTGVASSWTTDDIVAAIRPISTLGAPSVSASGSSSNVAYSWSGAACPNGTSKQYQWYRIGSWGGTFGWWGPITETTHDWPDSSQGYTFTLQVQQRCVSDFYTGAWSGSGSAAYARPVTAPGAPGGFKADASAGGIAFSWNAPTCGAGTQGQWRADWANGGGTGIKWINPPSGHEDYWWYGAAAAGPSYANPSSAWTTAWPSYGYMGDRNNPYAISPPRMNLDAGTAGAFDSQNHMVMAVEYRCINPTSGIAGPVGGLSYGSYTY